MRRIKTPGVALAATLAVVALCLAASASASAENLRFEAINWTFNGEAVETYQHPIQLETVGGRLLECESLTAKGEATGERSAAMTMDFNNCKPSTLSWQCGNTATAGQIEAKMTAELGFDGQGGQASEVALQMTPQNFKFRCSSGAVFTEWTVTNSMICPITPVNEMTETFEVSCRQTKGFQEYGHLYDEEGKLVSLFGRLYVTAKGFESWGPEELGISALLDLRSNEFRVNEIVS